MFTAVLVVVPIAGCTDDSASDDRRPVVDRTTTTAADAGTEVTTSTPDTSVESPSTSSAGTPVSPPSTRPLTTAPPSDLLTEVTAAYDAAYADLLAAGAIPDPNYPALTDHMDAGQAEQWRTVLRGLVSEGKRVQAAESGRWQRVESLVESSDVAVDLIVCRFDPDPSIDSAGNVTNLDSRPYRYRETFLRVNGVWKWAGREWIDSNDSSSDCALP